MLVLITGLLWAVPTLWTRAVGAEDKRRNHTVDGARGLLSLWVLTHHLNGIPFWVIGVANPAPPEGTVTLLMQSAFFIAPFYALTGMLFGGAMLASAGKLSTWRFLRNRAFRLAPVYFLSIIVVVVVAFYMTGFELKVPPAKLIKEIARWCAFGFLPRWDINTAEIAKWHGMLWTLPYEIEFYVLLPLLAWGQRKLRSPLVLIGGVGLLAFFSWQFMYITAGVLAAAALGWKHRYAKTVWTGLCVLAVVLLAVTAPLKNAPLQALLLIPILVAIAHQVPMLRPFRARAIRFVGEISYSVYILHFPLICIIFSLIVDPHWLNGLSQWPRAFVLAGLGGVILFLAAMSYIFVERPLIAFGRRHGSIIVLPRRPFGRRAEPI